MEVDSRTSHHRTLGTVTKGLEKVKEKISIIGTIGFIQITAFRKAMKLQKVIFLKRLATTWSPV